MGDLDPGFLRSRPGAVTAVNPWGRLLYVVVPPLRTCETGMMIESICRDCLQIKCINMC